MSTSTPPALSPPRALGRGYLWAGLGLALLAAILVVVQLSLRWLFMPWYLPALTTLGAVLLAVAVRRQKGFGRSIAFALVFLLAALQWYFLGVMMKLAPYEGPAQAGRHMPAFETRLADGSKFTVADFQRGVPSVLVFFRGHW